MDCKLIMNILKILILSLFLCTVPWGFSNQFVHAQTGQFFIFIIFSVAILSLHLLRLSKPLTSLILNITKTDILLLSLIVLTGIHCFIQNYFSIAFILETISYILLYITLRGIDKKYNVILLFSLLIAGTAQAIYGILQLYDIYPSNHSTFKITGSFFNPGPYSGYLVSIIPLALALFLLKYTTRLNHHKNISGTEFPAPNKSTNIKDLGSMSESALEPLVQKITKTAYQNRTKLSQYLIGISIITTLLVLPASRSRAAWVAIASSLLFVFMHMWQPDFLRNITLFKGKWKVRVDKLLRKTIIKVIGAITVVVLLLSGLFSLYTMKQGSIDGRFLIWKVSSQIIKDKPIFGHGINAFEAKYMDYQANYFVENLISYESLVADNTKYAFNEFIRIGVEMGIIGLVICLIIIGLVLFGKTTRLNQTEKLFLIAFRTTFVAIIIFGLFSYPAEIIPIKINIVVLLALVANYLKPSQVLKIVPMNFDVKTSYQNQNTFLLNFGRIPIITLLLFGGYIFIQNAVRLYDANTNWKRAFTIYQMGAYEICIKDYEKTFPYLRYNGDFLLNYGKALSMAEKHDKALEILEYAREYYPNTILYAALGDSQKALGKIGKAEKAYLYAWQMIPSRFYPKYLLAKLYDETGQKEKAVKIAYELLNKEVKIESDAIEEMKQEMRSIISKHQLS